MSVPIDDTDPEISNRVRTTLGQSGLPLQMAIAEMVRSTTTWIVDEEVPWRDESSEKDRFLDFAATTENGIVTVECKKTAKEIWTFLQLVSGREVEGTAPCLDVTPPWAINQGDDKRTRVYLADWWLPPCPVSAFCVVTNGRPLEEVAQELLRATDEYARRGVRGRWSALSRETPVIPLIVTNAKIFVARFARADVPLETGSLVEHPSPVDIAPADAVQFRKRFLAHRDRDLGERAVLVVRSVALMALLQSLDTTYGSPHRYRREYPLE